MGGARLQVTPTSQVYTNVSRIFEPPQFTELLNVRFDDVTNNGSLFHNRLRSQRGTSAEIGTRGKEGPVTWDVAYYYAWLHRELIATSPFPGTSFVSNARRTAHQGIELAAQVDFYDGFFFRPGYTWSHFKFRNDPAFGDNHLPGVPEHLFNLELGYACKCGAFISVTSEVVPRKYPADYANSVFADRYATYGLRLGYRRDTGVSFFVEIRNITDQRYVSSVNQVADAAGADLANFHPAFARAYYVGAEVRW
jgi:iron complex outermembrane recepter protein